ncbi:hypothetical protein SERLA73DRAFT_178198 [Serpula lacrymans var. lacrymans S7.3]|uniref:Uncharacterized protein n=1 Tax=Serpula lacrymans var. lacrymans (strain S7.3) TaxID=936435 RepID=F8PQW9_SERL3|nr:hypothetical protein SERLA73DRAFT_178198 [Serpula lacrymans var. lacrymans S7.3]
MLIRLVSLELPLAFPLGVGVEPDSERALFARGVGEPYVSDDARRGVVSFPVLVSQILSWSFALTIIVSVVDLLWRALVDDGFDMGGADMMLPRERDDERDSEVSPAGG